MPRKEIVEVFRNTLQDAFDSGDDNNFGKCDVNFLERIKAGDTNDQILDDLWEACLLIGGVADAPPREEIQPYIVDILNRIREENK